jgi:hypothetical protein
MTEDDIKDALKDALKEWLDEKFAQFGKWSLTAFSLLAFTALVYFVLTMNGWKLG